MVVSALTASGLLRKPSAVRNVLGSMRSPPADHTAGAKPYVFHSSPGFA